MGIRKIGKHGGKVRGLHGIVVTNSPGGDTRYFPKKKAIKKKETKKKTVKKANKNVESLHGINPSFFGSMEEFSKKIKDDFESSRNS